MTEKLYGKKGNSIFVFLGGFFCCFFLHISTLLLQPFLLCDLIHQQQMSVNITDYKRKAPLYTLYTNVFPGTVVKNTHVQRGLLLFAMF